MSALCMTAGLQPVLCSTKPRTTLLQQVVRGSSPIDDAISILKENGYVLKGDAATADCKGIIVKDPQNYDIEYVELGLTNGEYSLNVYDTLWTADAQKRVQENGGTFLGKEFPICGNARDIDKTIEYLKAHEDDAFNGDGFFPYVFIRKEETPE